VNENNISGTAEWICAKFTGKTCLGPRSEEFECQGQRSRSPGTKNTLCTPITPAATEWNAFAVNNVAHEQTEPFGRCRGLISAAYVRSLFCKTSLALDF